MQVAGEFFHDKNGSDSPFKDPGTPFSPGNPQHTNRSEEVIVHRLQVRV